MTCTITRDPAAVRAARALRHRVFVSEGGAAAEIEPGLEGDGQDAACDHAIVTDPARPETGILATARFRAGTGWTDREFDLSMLSGRGLRLAEVGRTCVHPDQRGGLAGITLFAGLIAALRDRGVEGLVGPASFPGRDAGVHMQALRALRAAALAPPEWRPVAHGPGAVRVEGEAPRRAMVGVPPLIKSYLRAGAWVGEGACVDAAFNVVDVCIVLDMTRLRLPPAIAG